MKTHASFHPLTLAHAFEQFLEVSPFAQRTRESYTEDLKPLFAEAGQQPVRALTVLSELKPYLGKAMTLLLCFFNKDKVERGALANELSLLHGNDDEETNKENPTGLRHVLLPSLSLYL